MWEDIRTYAMYIERLAYMMETCCGSSCQVSLYISAFRLHLYIRGTAAYRPETITAQKWYIMYVHYKGVFATVTIDVFLVSPSSWQEFAQTTPPHTLVHTQSYVIIVVASIDVNHAPCIVPA